MKKIEIVVNQVQTADGFSVTASVDCPEGGTPMEQAFGKYLLSAVLKAAQQFSRRTNADVYRECVQVDPPRGGR